MVKKLVQGDTRRTSGLWDDEIDGSSSKPSDYSPTGLTSVRPRVWIGAGACLVELLLLAALVGPELVQELRFQDKVSVVNQRARRLGGGVSNGRRAFRFHVGAWFHGREITDRAMPEIISIIRECQSRGLGSAHLSLDLSRTSVGDAGIKLLHAVPGLEFVSIRDTNVTKEGVDSLRRALPKTLVDAWPIYPPAEEARTESGARNWSG